MKSGYSRLGIEFVNWVDPEILPHFEYALVRNGSRTALIGVLDLSCFPTVEELQQQLKESGELPSEG